MEILGHGSTCGKDPMAGNDEEAFIGLIGSRLSSKPSVYINGCETATWAEYLSKQKGWENATVYGNSDNIYGKIGALLELSKKGYKNGEEIK